MITNKIFQSKKFILISNFRKLNTSKSERERPKHFEELAALSTHSVGCGRRSRPGETRSFT